MRSLWAPIAAELAAWPGTVIADLGRLQTGNPALPVARSAAAVLLLTRVDLESLAHLRDRVGELAAGVGDPGRDRSPVGVVVTGPARSASFGPDQVRQLLASIGSPAPVLGFWPHDPAAAKGLWEGQLTRRLAGSSTAPLGPVDRRDRAGHLAAADPRRTAGRRRRHRRRHADRASRRPGRRG